MATANPYDPDNRDNAMKVKYRVSRTGDRWFIPYNDNASTSDQLAQCKKVVGEDNQGNNTNHGVEVVA